MKSSAIKLKRGRQFENLIFSLLKVRTFKSGGMLRKLKCSHFLLNLKWYLEHFFVTFPQFYLFVYYSNAKGKTLSKKSFLNCMC